MNIFEQNGFKIEDLEELDLLTSEILLKLDAKQEFVEKYTELKGYEALEFTEEEKAAARNYLNEHGIMADLMNSRREIKDEEIIKELDCYVKGYAEEKKKMASLIGRFYMVHKNRDYPADFNSIELSILDDIMFDKRIENMPDELKYAMLEMLKHAFAKKLSK